MAKQTSTALVGPHLGLRYDAPPIGLREGEVQEGLNFRVKEGRLTNLNLGWQRFSSFTLNGSVRLIDDFFSSIANEHLIFGTQTDLYRYRPAPDDDVRFITPAYVTGTVSDQIPNATGTPIGDMTGGGNLAAAVDNTTAQALAACANKAAATDAYIGKTYTGRILGATVYGSNDQGYVNGANPSVTIQLRGKTGAAPASPSSDGTLLGTITFTDTANESTGRDITSSDTTTAWDHVWLYITQAGGAATMAVAEMRFFSKNRVFGAGTSWSTNIAVGDQLYVGSATQNDPAAAWSTVLTVDSNTQLTISTGLNTTFYTAQAYTIRRLFSGDTDDVWSYDTFVNAAGVETRWYATNGVDPLVRWNGTDTFCTRLDSFGLTNIKALTVYNNMMIYANFEVSGTHFPSSIVNSDVGDPEDITSGLSEQFVVHSETSPISAIYPLGDNLVVYSSRIIVVAQFVGDPLIFAFRTATSGVGPLSPNAIADYGDHHAFIGFDAKYTFDGVTLDTIDQHVWREIIRRNDPVRRNAAFAHFDEENGDLIWVLALTTDSGSGTAGSGPEQAFVEHYLEEPPQGLPTPYSRRTFPFTVGGFYQRAEGLTWDQLTSAWETYNFRWNDQFFSAAFPLNIMGSDSGKVYIINTSQNTDTGAALQSYVRFGRRATGDGKMRALVRRIYPFVESYTSPINITLRLADHAAGPITTTDTISFDQSLPEGGHFTSPFRRGRFMELEFGTDGPSEPWQIQGYDVEITPGGYR